MSYRLFYGTKKVPLRYGYYEGPCVVYSDMVQFYEHNTRFVEAVDLYKLSYEEKTTYAICHSHRALETAAINLIHPRYSSDLDHLYEVVIEDRHHADKSMLVGGVFSRLSLVTDAHFSCWRNCKVVNRLMAGERIIIGDCCGALECPLESILSKEGSI